MKNYLVAAVAALALSASANAATVYSNDFESGSVTGITGSTSVLTAPGNGNKFLGELAFGSSSTLTLNTTGYTNLQLAFDLLALDSLDGDSTSVGPDNFTLKINGFQVFNESFANPSTSTQSYGGAGSPGGTGSDAALTGTLGYGYYGPDHTYHLSFALPSVALTTIQFIGNSSQGASDEGFGIDKILVTGTARVVGAVPEPASWAMLILGFGMVGAGFRRKFLRPITA